MGLGKFLKKIAPVALPIIGTLAAPGIGTALGSSLGAATLAGIGGAVGGAAGGGLGGGGLSGALTGAALGGAGGYLSGGGLSDLLSGTSLGSGINSLTNSAGLGDVISPAADAARTAVSGAATSAVPSGGILSGYLPTGGAGGAGGGTSGGFLDGIFGGGTGATAVGKETLPWLTDVSSGATAANPFTDYAALTGATTVAPPTKSLAGSALKLALPSLLSKDNASGYDVVGQAGRDAAAAYQPFVAGGQQATKTLADLYGLNGTDAAAAATAGFENTPGYQFARDQGIKALDASAAAKGMLRSGNQEQAVQNYGTGLAQQYYQQYLQNLQNQAGTGVNAAGGMTAGNMTAADAYAMLKQNKTNDANRLVGGLSAFL